MVSQPSPPESFKICAMTTEGQLCGHGGGERREGIVVNDSEVQKSEISEEGQGISDVDQALKYVCGLYPLFSILFLIYRIFNLGMQLVAEK